MTLKFYNSLTQQVEEFKPITPGEVRLYACGPTVYNYAHIGNFRAYVFADLLRRYLRYKGFRVKHVMNITDVDDKTIRDSQKEGKPLRAFTDFYLEEYLKDLDSLHIERPDLMPRATDEIDSMVRMIEALLEKGHAYRSEKGDIYFKINSYDQYGKLINLDLSKTKQNADGRLSNVDEYDKENANDFALWKAHDADDGDVFWETSIGKGRPGWHIECSAMSTNYLGESFDIHVGGIDLKFPHHTNEIAQSECTYGVKFVNLWMHNEHLLVNGQKMSKSLGNFFTLRDLLEKGYHPLAIRLELLKSHYRQRADFREDNLKSNVKILEKFEACQSQLRASEGATSWVGLEACIREAQGGFEKALDNDLNISEALAALFEFVTELNKNMEEIGAEDAKRALRAFEAFNSVLGVLDYTSDVAIDEEVEKLIEERQQARKDKNFGRADEIRDELFAMGVELKDTPEGVTWKKVS